MNGARSSGCVASTVGRAAWLSTVARPWPGACLPTGCTPAASSPAAQAAASSPTTAGSAANARSPMTALAPRDRTIQHRAGDDADPGRGGLPARSSAPVSQAARRAAGGLVANSAPSRDAAGWRSQCGGRKRATRPPLLVDHDDAKRWQQPLELEGERRDLTRRVDVAGEQDGAGRAMLPNQRGFVRRNAMPGNPDNGRLQASAFLSPGPKNPLPRERVG